VEEPTQTEGSKSATSSIDNHHSLTLSGKLQSVT